MGRCADRRIIVTGGGSGIGQATVLRLLAEAGTVYTLDVDVAGLDRTRALAATGRFDGQLSAAGFIGLSSPIVRTCGLRCTKDLEHILSIERMCSCPNSVAGSVSAKSWW
jgi:NAD(P)-dependent dehydrogenase (short-subunit alcohol dehydrogenase family)